MHTFRRELVEIGISVGKLNKNIRRNWNETFQS